MIKKIVSGGQTGADQAALDVAIKLDIPHGGWAPRGRLTEDGPLPEKYHLEEMPTGNYQDRTEQNVIDSDGTVILSHGKLSGGSAYTRDMALQHARPWLHIDLNKMLKFEAAQKISAWIAENGVEILNVAGPRASRDPAIYNNVLEILEAAYTLNLGEKKPILSTEAPVSGKGADRQANTLPKTVDEAVNQLLPVMSLRDKTTLANMTEDNLPILKSTLGQYIRNRLTLWCVTPELLKSCMSHAGKTTLNRDEASMVIIRELWKKLKKTHVLRVVR